jgi:hypothetical protein
MNSKENIKKQLHIFTVQSASNIFILASVCSNSANGVQVKLHKKKQKKMYVKQINIRIKGKQKTVKEVF